MRFMRILLVFVATTCLMHAILDTNIWLRWLWASAAVSFTVLASWERKERDQ